ncbi:MAG TPA: tRNA pseudouridine(55) synthase TruB [Myxococcaceae bacterium]|nr:tRNA pseudouridine(55) synthase TruB [Myxococcaceae bacterium]
MNGVLVIDKPSGPTSFDVVRRVRALLGVRKVGHTGTLDPLATGVLPVCVGQATRIAGFITEGNKAYEAIVRLGVETDTLDAAGSEVASAPVPPLDAARLEAVLSRFRGTFLQTPPMYSAVKVRGRRLYELARAGEEVERAPRMVTVHELVLRDFSSDELRLSVACSKGFFVRSLAEEIGKALGCGAHLRALRRTRSGPFTLAQAVPLERLESGDLAEVEARLVSLNDALSELPALRVSESDASRVGHGVPLEVSAPPGRVRVVDSGEGLLAIAEVGASGRLKYLRVLTSGDS